MDDHKCVIKLLHHECVIGLLHYNCEYSGLVTLDMLKDHIWDNKEMNRIIDDDPVLRYAKELRVKEWTLKDYGDKRKSTNLRRFDFCPDCGKKIDWAEIRRKEIE